MKVIMMMSEIIKNDKKNGGKFVHDTFNSIQVRYHTIIT